MIASVLWGKHYLQMSVLTLFFLKKIIDKHWDTNVFAIWYILGTFIKPNVKC